MEYETKGVKVSNNSEFDILKFDPKYFEFSVSEGRPNNSDFYINSNFFGVDGTPIGFVVIDGDIKSSKAENKKGKEIGGYFYVKDGKPYVSRECASNPEYSSQTHISYGIDNGRLKGIGKSPETTKERRFRNLIGMTKENKIVFIISKTRITIDSVLNVGLEYNLETGLVYDGGSSVEYYFNDGGKHTSSFQGWSNTLKFFLGFDSPPIYIAGSFK